MLPVSEIIGTGCSCYYAHGVWNHVCTVCVCGHLPSPPQEEKKAQGENALCLYAEVSVPDKCRERLGRRVRYDRNMVLVVPLQDCVFISNWRFTSILSFNIMHFLLSSFLFPILTNNEPTHAKYSRKAIDPIPSLLFLSLPNRWTSIPQKYKRQAVCLRQEEMEWSTAHKRHYETKNKIPFFRYCGACFLPLTLHKNS